ncbi:hypothetical protein JCM14469_34340 [Desulfatiferula olefinivorans]
MMIDLGRRPISEACPQGEDVRYHDLFLALDAEMSKRTSPTDRDGFSWQTVLDLSTEILTHQAKDLLVAGYLAVALLHLKGGEGLEAASILIADLIEHFWDTLYPAPKRRQGRIAALSWWAERTGEALAANPDIRLPEDRIRAVTHRLGDADRFLAEHLPGAPGLGPLIRAIEGRIGAETKTPGPNAPSPPPPPVPAAPSVVPMADQPEEAVKQLIPLFQNIKQTAKLLRLENDRNPQAYHWLRFAIWEPLRALPPSTNTITRIPPPQSQTVSRLNHLADQRDYPALIQAAESALANPKNLFFLELNLFTFQALDGLGPSHQAAARTVLTDTALFIERLKGLEQLLFSDGTPLINEKTSEWLKTVDYSLNQSDNLSDASSDTTVDALRDEIKTIREHVNDHRDLPRAVAAFQALAGRCPAKKDALPVRLELARLLASEKQDLTAAALLESMMDDLDRHGLSAWDPALSLAILTLSAKVFRRLPETRYRDKAADVLVRIAALDPGRILAL